MEKYYVPSTIIALRPIAEAAIAGLQWRTREGTGTKERLWICMENSNDDGNYEWVLVMNST